MCKDEKPRRKLAAKLFFFWLSFNFDLEPYTFQIVNTTQEHKQKLGIDEMIITLINHCGQIQFSE